jgi:hypothetical protein
MTIIPIDVRMASRCLLKFKAAAVTRSPQTGSGSRLMNDGIDGAQRKEPENERAKAPELAAHL